MSPAPSSRARAVAVTIGAATMLYAVFIVGLPWLILSMSRGVPSLALPIGPLRWLGLPLVAFGLYLYGWSLVKLEVLGEKKTRSTPEFSTRSLVSPVS